MLYTWGLKWSFIVLMIHLGVNHPLCQDRLLTLVLYLGNQKMLAPWKKAMTNLDSILKSRDISLPTKACLVKAMVFPVVIYGCESWTIKKAEHRRIGAFELWCWRRLLRVCKEIQPVHPKGDQSWIFIGKTDAEAETPILWPWDSKNWLNGKDSDAGEDWRQKEKEMTEGEMVEWHHWLDGHEFE